MKKAISFVLLIVLVMSVMTAAFAESSDEYRIDPSKKYVGVYMKHSTEMDVFGDSVNTLAWFDTVGSMTPARVEMCLDEHKYTAFITLQPHGMTMKEIAAGEHDDAIIASLKPLGEGDRVKTDCFVRFAHEFEMRPKYKRAWYDWQGKDTESYIAAWRHVVELGRQYAPNIKWVWSPNRADKYTKPYYPGDEYVDYVSVSLNNFKNEYKTFQKFYEQVGQRSFLEEYNKPIIFSEVAEHCGKPKQRAKYFASIMEFVMSYDKAFGIMVLNSNVINGDGAQRNFRFDDNEEIFTAFTEKSREYIGR